MITKQCALALARSQRCSSVNTVVPAIDDGLPALPGARAGRFGSRADALRGVGSSLSGPLPRGEWRARRVVRIVEASLHRPPRPTRPIAWRTNSYKALARRPSDNLPRPRSRQRVLRLQIRGQQEKTARQGRAQLICQAPARERVRSSRRYVARAGRFFCSARRWMPRAGPLGGRNVCGARDTRKIIAARRSLILPQA